MPRAGSSRSISSRCRVPGAGIVVATPSGANTYTFTQREIRRQLHPHLPPTPIWAYDDGSGLAGQAGSFGMAVVAHSGTPLDRALHARASGHLSRTGCRSTRDSRRSAIRCELMTHLHGGFVAGESDGNPAVDSDRLRTRRNADRALHQSGAANASLAALVPRSRPRRDATQRLRRPRRGVHRARRFDTGAEPNPIGIPGGAYEIPLVIQDRQFNADGTFLYPRSDIAGATWIGEYFGDVMLVNGKVWPFLDVEPRMYRLRILNGCNARILNLDIGGATFWQIGAEGGLFDVPVPVKQTGARAGRASRRDRRLQQVRRQRAGDEEP